MPSKQSGHQCPAKLLHLPLMESSRRSYGVRKVHANKIKNKRRTKQTKPGWWTDHHHAHWHPVEAQALERAISAREAAEAGNVVAGGERLQEFTQKAGFTSAHSTICQDCSGSPSEHTQRNHPIHFLVLEKMLVFVRTNQGA
jgi:hypothetical protein